jgi:hypothetical protein
MHDRMYVELTATYDPFFAVLPSGAAPVQRKLVVGEPGDRYEREADRVADAIMRMPAPHGRRVKEEDGRPAPGPSPLLGRIRPIISRQEGDEEERESCFPALQCKPAPSMVYRQVEAGKDEEEEEDGILQAKRSKAVESVNIQRQIDEEEEKDEEEVLQRKTGIQEHGSAVRSIALDARSMRGRGRPLDSSTREFMESRFGFDFDRVRIHTNARADGLARGVNATAFALGRDIVFRNGRYAPGSTAGRQLLAHELAHVIQQSSHSERRSAAGRAGM